MDISHLRYFLTVAQFRHMTQAADHLYISQSSLSKHISQLEGELELKLFDRTGRTIRLSSAGQEFLPFAEEMVAKHEVMLLKLKNYRTTEAGEITLGSIPIIAQYDIHRALLAFQKQYPDITVRVFEEKGIQVMKMMEDALLDLAIVRTATLPDNSYKVMPLAEDELVLVVSKEHPLAQKKQPLSLTEAANEEFIFLDSGPGLHDLCMAACTKAGFTPPIRYRYTRIETIIGFVTEGLGVSLLMKKAIAFFQYPDIVSIKLKEPVKSTVALVFPHGKKLSPSANLFRNFLLNWFKH